MKTVLVTGANGFVGKHLCELLRERGFQVRAAVRTIPDGCDDADLFAVGSIDARTNWQDALQGVNAVVHLAARVHVLEETATDPLTEFRKVNTVGTKNLAQQALNAGVQRFVYISSVKATATTTISASLESDAPAPLDPYGRSKQEAEALLLQAGQEGPLEPVVIRPPLVFGAGVGGNFLRLLTIVRKGIPLPLRNVENRRSVVSVYNLCDFIAHCLVHPKAAHQIFNVSDSHDLSTPELLVAIGRSMHRPARLWPFPPSLMRMMLRIVGKADDYDRLFGSLQLSIEKAKALLDWSPVITTKDGIDRTVEWYCEK